MKTKTWEFTANFADSRTLWIQPESLGLAALCREGLSVLWHLPPYETVYLTVSDTRRPYTHRVRVLAHDPDSVVHSRWASGARGSIRRILDPDFGHLLVKHELAKFDTPSTIWVSLEYEA